MSAHLCRAWALALGIMNVMRRRDCFGVVAAGVALPVALPGLLERAARVSERDCVQVFREDGVPSSAFAWLWTAGTLSWRRGSSATWKGRVRCRIGFRWEFVREDSLAFESEAWPLPEVDHYVRLRVSCRSEGRRTVIAIGPCVVRGRRLVGCFRLHVRSVQLAPQAKAVVN